MRKVMLVSMVLLVVAACGRTSYDFDGDHRADLVWIDHTTGAWTDITDGVSTVIHTSDPDDEPVPADYDGDGTTEIAVVRPNGDWVTQGASGTIAYPRPATLNDHTQISPVPGDYDGNGRAEPAWFRDTDAAYFILGRDPVVLGATVAPMPGSGRVHDYSQEFAAPADYDGDGALDVATWNQVNGEFRIRNSHDGSDTSVTIAPPDAIQPQPVPGNYDGTQGAVPAVFDMANGWTIAGRAQPDVYGTRDWHTTDFVLATPADHNGDGRLELSVFTSHGEWFIAGTTDPILLPAYQVDPPGSAHRAFPASFPAVGLSGVARSTLITRCLVFDSC